MKLIINEIEDQIISLTRITLTRATGFGIIKTELLTIQALAKITMAFAIIITTTETIPKRLMHNRLSIPKGPKYDDRYPRENKFRENEQVAKQFYDQENRQFIINPRGRPYDTGSYNSNNSRDSTRSQSPNFRSNQIQSETTYWVEEEVNYCEAITDFFPLNY